MGTNEKSTSKSNGRTNKSTTKYITLLYTRLLEMGYLYKDLYDMTIIELEETIVNRKKGKAYEMWRLASLTRSPFIKNFPNSPEEACPELYPPKEGIKMPSFLVEKAIKRGVL